MSIKDLDDTNFDTVNASDKAVLKFSATWCGPCKMFAPIFDKVAEKTKEVDFYKADVDEADQIATKFSVMSVPTVIYLKKGEEVGRTSGLIGEDAFEMEIKEKLG